MASIHFDPDSISNECFVSSWRDREQFAVLETDGIL
jgi:hypothetical protein